MKNKALLISLAFIFVIILVLSSYMILSQVMEYEKSKREYTELSKENVTVVAPSDIKAEQETAPITVDFDNLTSKNPDVVGWLYSEGTPINYPVAQSKDNNYYLRRSLSGKYDRAGTLFMDYRHKADMSVLNTIVYGHNMLNDTMFGSLLKYEKQDYYEKHPVLWYITPEKNYKIELIMGLIAGPSADIYDNCESREELLLLLDELKSASTFDSDVEYDENSKFITLSTCSYEFKEARYIVIGTLKPIS